MFVDFSVSLFEIAVYLFIGSGAMKIQGLREKRCVLELAS